MGWSWIELGWKLYWVRLKLGCDNYNFYLYKILEYSEYDFKNWQSLESLEDSFWESNFSSYSQDEYIQTGQLNSSYDYFNKVQLFYNVSNRLFSQQNYYGIVKFFTANYLYDLNYFSKSISKPKLKYMYKPFIKDNTYNLDNNILVLNSNEGLVNPGQITSDNFFYFTSYFSSCKKDKIG